MRIGIQGLGLALLAAVPALAHAQVGVVLDRSGAPVGGAVVTLRADGSEGAPWRVQADARGWFEVPSAWSGPASIEVGQLGYRTLTLTWSEAQAASWRFALETDPLELEAVVVTATGRAQRRTEIAVPIALVSAEEIQASGATSAESLLREIPGLQSTSVAPVGSNIMIRGIGDSRVLVLLDGQPAGGALLENRDLSRMSLAGVERVEVVKGPLSSQYGSDALGGVINVITREPEAGLRADARVMAGGAGRREADATVSGGGAVRYRVTGSWRQEDQVPGLQSSLDVFARVWDLRSSVAYDDGGPFRVRSDVSFVRERQRWPVGGGFSGFNDNRGITAWAEIGRDLGPGELTVRSFGQDYDHNYRSARGDTPFEGTDNLQQERVWEGSLGYAAELGGHDFGVGIEGSLRTIESPDKLLEDRASDEQVEVFGQDAWQLGRLTLTGGVRLTMNDRWGNAFSPNVGATALLVDNLMARAAVGRGFRAPSFKELAWDFANIGAGYTVQGFSGLDPEDSWSVSGGVEWAPFSRLSLALEAYTNEIDNLIEFAFVGNTPQGLQIFSPRNVARARTRGFEATADARFGRVQVAADYAFLRARSLDDDLPLDRRAEHSARLRAAAEVGILRGARVDVTGHFTGQAPLVGVDGSGLPAEVGTQDALLSLDAQVSVEVPGGLRLIAGVDNVLDSAPDGWQASVRRQLRVGLEAIDLF